MTLSSDQQLAFDGIDDFLHSGRKIAALAGYAGCGKTFLVSELIKTLEQDKVLLVTPTGKAANVLKLAMRKAGVFVDVTTIHSAVYGKPTERLMRIDQWGNKVECKKGEKEDTVDLLWSRKGEVDKDRMIELVIIDESSMVTRDLFRDLVDSFSPSTQFLCVGDKGQLPPVGESAGLLDNPDWLLSKIHRQAAENPIIECARICREESPEKAIEFARNSTDPRLSVVKVSSKEQADALAKQIFAEGLDEGMFLCATNSLRVAINQGVREAFARSGDPSPGEIVVCLRNHYPSGLRNGERFILEQEVPQLQWYAPLEQFNQEKTLSGRQVGSGLLLDYGYAITTHKAQGSQAKNAVVVLNGVEWLKRNGEYTKWLYTAITRASDRLVFWE